MYKNILRAIDLNDETSYRKPAFSAVELARTFGARLHILTVVREVEAILEASGRRPAACGLIALLLLELTKIFVSPRFTARAGQPARQ